MQRRARSHVASCCFVSGRTPFCVLRDHLLGDWHFSSRSGQSGSSLVASTAQSALMPIGDTVTLAVARSDALDYGRIRLWGSVSFILASLGSGTVLASTWGADALLLVLGASALLTLARLAVPQQRQPTRGSSRFADMRAFVGNRRFSVLSSVPRHCKPVTKSITVLELFTGARLVSRRRRLACFGLRAPLPGSCCSGTANVCSPGLAGRTDDDWGRGRNHPLDPLGSTDLAAVYRGVAALARLYFRGELSRRNAFPLPRHTVLGGGRGAKHLCRGFLRPRRRARYGVGGCALRRLRRNGLSLHGRPLRSRAIKRFRTAKDGALNGPEATAVSLWRFFNYRFIGRSSGEPCPSVRSPCAFWMSVVDDVGDGVIVERPRVESASQFQHLGRLLADLRRWDNGLFASRLIGQAGLPGIEYALRVLGPGAAEMVDHRVLIADDRVLVTRPEFTVNGVSAS